MLEYLLLSTEVVWAIEVVLNDEGTYRMCLRVLGHGLSIIAINVKTGFYHPRTLCHGRNIDAVACCGEIVLVRIDNSCLRYDVGTDRLSVCQLVAL